MIAAEVAQAAREIAAEVVQAARVIAVEVVRAAEAAGEQAEKINQRIY